MFALFFLHFVPFFSDWLNFVAQELKPKEKIYLVNKLHASCRLSHSAHIKTLRKTITITKRCRINGDCLVGKVMLWDEDDENIPIAKKSKKKRKSLNLHKCQICDKACKGPLKLKFHVSTIHDGVKEPKCDFCELTFSEFDELQKSEICVAGLL